MQRCPTCGHWWVPVPAWWQFWLWPVYWTRCPFLDLFDIPIPLDDPELLELFSDMEHVTHG